ncbi:nucleoside hydrolase [Pengzhenrongella frigida]|nr:nucleoside hydrolase [Cellulomonas sp. HLT2-17]
MTQATWALGETPWLFGDGGHPAPRSRVIIDNDFSGDPDDLYQVVHHVLSPSVDIRAIIGSHLRPDDPFDSGPDTAANACQRLRELFAVMGLDAEDRIFQGADVALKDRTTAHDTPAARAIIAEAMRDDTDTPLFVVCGGGLTDLASAWLLEPRIAERLTVVWIGGPEYPQLAAEPPGITNPEYNLAIDVVAGQVLFNDSPLDLWQVPRNIYRQCLVSDIELRLRVAGRGPLGRFLYDSISVVDRHVWATGALRAETYALGDSPLVLLTALQSYFQPDSSSSDHVVLPAPLLDDTGAATPRPDGRPIRVYTRVDTRLMFEDMFGKLQAFADWRTER